MDIIEIDAFDFSRRKEQRTGQVPIASLPRLASEAANSSGSLEWHVQGGKDDRGYSQLTLGVKGVIQLVCQRCLTPLDYLIDSESVLVLAQDEAAADELDLVLAEEESEVVVAGVLINLLTLVEDESLLALPTAPKHEICPARGESPPVAGEKKESPFAVLKKLKQ